MKWKILGAVLAVTLVLPNVTRADFQVTATWTGYSPRANNVGSVQLNGGTVENMNGGGIFNWSTTPASPNSHNETTYFFQAKSPGAVTKNFISFCLELTQQVATGSEYTFTAKSLNDVPLDAPDDGIGGLEPMGSDAALALQKLWGFEMPKLLPKITDGDVSSADLIEVSAMQLAIWELASEGNPIVIGGTNGFDLNNGNLIVVGDLASAVATELGYKIRTKAQQLYDDSQAYFEGPLPDLYALTNPGKQDQLVERIAPVPEPTSLLAWGLLGFIGLVTSRRYRRRG